MTNNALTVWPVRTLSAALVCLVLVLAGCDREEKLPGARIDPRVPLGETEHLVSPITDTEIRNFEYKPLQNRAEPFVPPAAIVNAEWSHINGNARHTGFHPQLGSPLNQVWSARIGEGNSRRKQINAEPIVAEGLIFAMDSVSQLSAFTLAGIRQWTLDLASQTDSDRQVGSGGMAYDNEILYVTTEAGILYLIEARTGRIIRHQDFDAPAPYPPAAADGQVYVLTADSKGWGVNAANDRLLWTVSGGLTNVVLSGGVSPAIAGSTTIMPLNSGQIVSVENRSGGINWRAYTGGSSASEPKAFLLGLSGSPLFDSGFIYAATLAGRILKINGTDGSFVWERNLGASDTMWLAGGSLFLVADDGKLTRLNASDGTAIWQHQLPHFVQKNPRRRKDVHVNFGPILAGGRLLVASSSGSLFEYSPVDGALLAERSLPSGAATPPIVANGMMFLITTDGVLRAYR